MNENQGAEKRFNTLNIWMQSRMTVMLNAYIFINLSFLRIYPVIDGLAHTKYFNTIVRLRSV